jgi:hypothetical protein
VDRWEQTYANILCVGTSGANVLQSVEIQRQVMMPVIGQDTATIVSEDPGRDVIIGGDGVLSPNCVPERRLRILGQDPNTPGTFVARFFGYISAIEPDPVAQAPFLVTVTVDSILRWLASRSVTPAAIPADGVVYDPDDPDHSALTQLLIAAGLWAAPMLNLEAPRGDPVPLAPAPTDSATNPSPADLVQPAGPWGGQPVQFGQTLGELIQLAGAVVDARPYYAVNNNDPDYVLYWWVPLAGASADFAFDAADGDLFRTPKINWSGDIP